MRYTSLPTTPGFITTLYWKRTGKMVMDKCIAISVKKGIDKLILYTNKKLIPAIRLYKNYGFQKIKLKGNKYIEADMYMELRMK